MMPSLKSKLSALALLALTSGTPIYYLTNCYNNVIQRAEIDYFKSTPALPASIPPSKIAVLNPSVTLDYEDGTWRSTKPFNITVVIGEDAYTAKVGTNVGSATEGTGNVVSCYRLTRSVVYTPSDGSSCTADYACY